MVVAPEGLRPDAKTTTARVRRLHDMNRETMAALSRGRQPTDRVVCIGVGRVVEFALKFLLCDALLRTLLSRGTNMETLIGLLGWGTFLCGFVGWIWITVFAFTEGETLWGVGCLIISPICLVFGFLNLQELKIPLALLIGGVVGKIAIAAISAGIA